MKTHVMTDVIQEDLDLFRDLVTWKEYQWSQGERAGGGMVIESFSLVQLSDPMDYSPPGFSVHGILQARILEWVAVPFSRGSSQPRDQTQDFPHCRQNLYCLSHQESHTQLSVVYSSLLNSQLLRWICGRDRKSVV